MTHRVALTTTARKERLKIDPAEREAIDRALQQLHSNPRPPGVKKLAGSRTDWRIRIGNYRILYEIDDSQRVVTVWRIAHRRQAYR